MEALKETETNLTWLDEEAGVWKGWTYNVEKKRYYFDDIGNESLMGLWEGQWLNEEKEAELNNAGYFSDELHDFDDGYKSKKRSRITPFFGENR